MEHIFPLSELAGSCEPKSLTRWEAFLREAAVRELALLCPQCAGPFILLRRHDWVPEVASAAEQATRQLVVSLPPLQLLPWLPVMSCLKRKERRSSNCEEFVREEIFKKVSPEMVAEEVACWNHQDRRALCRFFEASNDIDRVFLQAFLDDSDSVVRQCAVRDFLRVETGIAMSDWLKFKTDPAPSIRWLVWHKMLENENADRISILKDGLLDGSAFIRGVAQFYAKKEELDPASFYRARLVTKGKKPLISLIAGLGETGKSDDYQVALPFIKEGKTRIRCVAFRTLARLDRDLCRPLALHYLEHGAPKLAKEAFRLFQSRLSWISAEEAWQLFRSTRSVICRTLVTQLSGLLGFWDELLFLLRILTCRANARDETALFQLKKVIFRANRVYSHPAEHCRSELLKLINSAKVRIPLGMTDELTHLLNTR